ncbi:MAG: GNAT family N-acetyltransferase [Pseudomonadota bacterium]|nr:GNAT family N-acetyltransferase [Pseudomonadota bacterium]
MPASGLDFRPATVADIPAVVALVTSAYRGEASRAGWTTEADFLDGNRIDPDLLRHHIQRPRSHVLVAERGSRMLACAHLADVEGVGYFGMFAVQPALQQAGVGSAVLTQCERIVRDDWQLAVMRMRVIDLRDSLIAWYQRRGYHRTGMFEPFPYGDPRFGIPRRDDLRFELLEKAL